MEHMSQNLPRAGSRPIAKYSEDQERDSSGRFGSGDGGYRPGEERQDMIDARDRSGGITVPAKLTDDNAKTFLTQAADAMTAAGLHPYISPGLSDSVIRGLQEGPYVPTNLQNWSMRDGKDEADFYNHASAGQVEFMVAVWGEKEGVRYDESTTYDEPDGDSHTEFEPDPQDMEKVGDRIEAALKDAGIDVVGQVKPSHWDAGFGTKDIGYHVVANR
jgi:hypothetical protein